MSTVGVLKGDCCIAKWRNMVPAERSALDGTVSGDFRNGPVTLSLKQAPALLAGQDFVIVPAHLDGLAEATLLVTERGDDPSDMLKMLHLGMNKSLGN